MSRQGYISTAATRREGAARRAAEHTARRAALAALTFEEWLTATGWDAARVLGSELEADLRDDHARLATA